VRHLSADTGLLLAYKGEDGVVAAELAQPLHDFKVLQVETVAVPNLAKKRCLVLLGHAEYTK
jgi:hypothetical protein